MMSEITSAADSIIANNRFIDLITGNLTFKQHSSSNGISLENRYFLKSILNDKILKNIKTKEV
jgi:hypothetical protein